MEEVVARTEGQFEIKTGEGRGGKYECFSSVYATTDAKRNYY